MSGTSSRKKNINCCSLFFCFQENPAVWPLERDIYHNSTMIMVWGLPLDCSRQGHRLGLVLYLICLSCSNLLV